MGNIMIGSCIVPIELLVAGGFILVLGLLVLILGPLLMCFEIEMRNKLCTYEPYEESEEDCFIDEDEL